MGGGRDARQLYRSDIIGIIVADNDGHIKEANDAFLKLVGYSRDELERGAVRWDHMTPPEWRESDERSVRESVARGFTQTTEKESSRTALACRSCTQARSSKRRPRIR